MNGVTNGTNGHEEHIQLPSAQPIKISANICIQPPLTRRGHGPALVLLVPNGVDLSKSDKTLDPPPLQKWAEEGYTVAQILLNDGNHDHFESYFDVIFSEMQKLGVGVCDSVDRVGLICKYEDMLHDMHRAKDKQHMMSLLLLI